MNRLFIFNIDRVISFLRLGSKHFLPDFCQSIQADGKRAKCTCKKCTNVYDILHFENKDDITVINIELPRDYSSI